MDTATPDSIKQLLHRFGLERDRLRGAVCRAAGIAESELDALEHLEADGPLTQRELGDRLMLSSGGMTMLVDRLERAGWVLRRPHPSDRRAVVVEPTKNAFAQVPKALVDFHTAIEHASAEIPSEHREAIAAFLEAVSRAANETVSALLHERPAG
ncbi:MAG: MarR family transcriptional regulator [Gaiellaceae bacterium]|jgi:DNA-binding MarR family transcriptional regulator